MCPPHSFNIIRFWLQNNFIQASKITIFFIIIFFLYRKKYIQWGKATFQTPWQFRSQKQYALKEKVSNTLNKFHNVSVESRANHLESLEAWIFSQGLEFLFSPLFSSWIMSQHYTVYVNSHLWWKTWIWHHWKNTFANNHFPIIWKCSIAVLQELQAVFIAPIVTYPLQDQRYVRCPCNWSGRVDINRTEP